MSPPNMPNMAEAFFEWAGTVKLKVVEKVINDFEIEEDKIADVSFDGVLEPIPEQKLLIKPEGQRKWIWITLWTIQFLEPDMIVIDCEGKQYRVMSRSDWANAGFYEYQLTQQPIKT
jgi:hypothetical protein